MQKKGNKMKISALGLCTNFYGNVIQQSPKSKKEVKPEIKELSKVTPDFSIKVPQNYKKIRTDKLPYNLTLHTYKTDNGYTVSVVPIDDSPVCVSITADVGANNEPSNLKGISHFIEHMLFNGTKGTNGYLKLKPEKKKKKVNKLGGQYNGVTSLFDTSYYVNIPLFKEKDLEEQVKLLASIIENPDFDRDYAEGLSLALYDAPTGNYSGTPTPLESAITVDDFDEFFGDIVEFSKIDFIETPIEKVYHRFNTAQRECLSNNKYFDINYDNLVGDLFDVDEVNE